jgi:hypothetical protein
MLYKNDEVYRLLPADHKLLKDKFPKWPIRLIYPESRVRKSKLKHNVLPDKPNSISFPLFATVKTPLGADTWRFAENKIYGSNNQIIYTPSNLILRGSMVLQEHDKELVYWLVKCCPFLEGGENFNGKVPKCIIEDLVGNAEKKAMKEEEAATLKALIYSSKMGLGETRLREVAKAYFIPDVNELTFAQVKLAVENRVLSDKRAGVEKFLELVEAEQVLDVRANLQNAIDRDIITFMAQKRIWAWVTEQGKKNIPICQTGAGQDPHEALYDYYLGDRSFAKEITSALKGNKVVMSEGADEPDLDKE